MGPLTHCTGSGYPRITYNTPTPPTRVEVSLIFHFFIPNHEVPMTAKYPEKTDRTFPNGYTSWLLPRHRKSKKKGKRKRHRNYEVPINPRNDPPTGASPPISPSTVQTAIKMWTLSSFRSALVTAGGSVKCPSLRNHLNTTSNVSTIPTHACLDTSRVPTYAYSTAHLRLGTNITRQDTQRDHPRKKRNW